MDDNQDATKLKVTLHANDIEVVSTTDASIWLSVMAKITGAKSPRVNDTDEDEAERKVGNDERSKNTDSPLTPLAKFADELGVDIERLEAACNPSQVEPFIRLDHKCYESFKTAPGQKRTPPTVLAATLLLLWNRQIAFGEVTTRLCAQVLNSIDVSDKNPSRSLKNCDFIQSKNDTNYKLNPIMLRKAEELALSYCNSR